MIITQTNFTFWTLLLGLVFIFQKPNASGSTLLSSPAVWWQVDAGEDVFLCEGDTAQLMATGAASYEWSPTAGLSCSDCPDPLALPSVTTTYFVMGNDGTFDSVLVTVSSPPQIVSVDFNNPTECNLPNGSVVVMASGQGPLEFSIDGGTVWSDNGIFTALPPGGYSVVVRNVDGTCQVQGPQGQLTVPQGPQILNLISNNPTLCDIPNGSIIVSASGGVSPLRYSIDGGMSWQNQNIFQLLGAGTYDVVVSNQDGSCPFGGGTVTLTGSPEEPDISGFFTAGPDECGGNNGLITIMVANDNGNFEYSINGGNSYQPGNSFTGLGEGIYPIAVRKTNGSCEVNGGFVELKSTNRPEIFGTSLVNPQGCGAANGNVTILAFGFSTLEFSINGGSTWQASNIFPGLLSGDYDIAVRNNDGTCFTEGETVSLEGLEPPTFSDVIVVNPSECGAEDGRIVIMASGNGSLEYSIDNGAAWSASALFDNLPAGFYEIKIRYEGGDCDTPYFLNPVELQASGFPPVIVDVAVEQPACGLANGSLSITAIGNGVLQYSINGGTSFQNSNQFTGLAAGSYAIAVSENGNNCLATSSATLVNVSCNDTVQVNIPAGTTTQYCLDPAVFDIPGTLTSGGFCGQGNPLTVFAPDIDLDCVTLVPAPGFIGTSPDLICVVHCFNNSASQCDTTYLAVTVQGQVSCNVFPSDTVNGNFFGNPTSFCVLTPLVQLQGFDLNFNGLPIFNPFDCKFEPTTAYSYSLLPGSGFSGPYSLTAWQVGGNSLTGFFNNVNELVDLMNFFDPSGDWQLDQPGAIIYGGNPATTYGNMAITHNPTGLNVVLSPNQLFVPTGFTVGLSFPGVNVLIATDPVTGCSDTLYIDASVDPPMTETVFLTTSVNMPTDPFCLSGDELPGGIINSVGYCGGPSNGGVPIVGDTCVFYVPALNFAGQDTFCMVVCDGGFPVQICDTTFFIVNVLPEVDTVYLTIPAGETTLDTCLSNFVIELPGTATSAEFCGINLNEISAGLNGNCISFSVVNNFSGTTEICIVHCSGPVCDTNYIILTVIPPIICDEIFDQDTIFQLVTASPGSLCIPISLGDIGGYVVTVDGVVFTQSYIPCNGGAAPGSQMPVAGFGPHEIIVTAQNGCADTVVFVLELQPISTDTIYLTTPVNTTLTNLCGNTDELPGNLASLTICSLPANGGFVQTSGECVAYNPNMDFTGTDGICLVLCDDSQPAFCDTFVFVITVVGPGDPCLPLFSPSQVFISLDNDTGTVCLPVPVTDIANYNILLDGTAYSGSLMACDFDSAYIYFYGLVFGQGNQGPYSVTWEANGNTFNATVANIAQLVGFMNDWDPNGDWVLDPVAFTIISSNDQGIYGDLTITHLATGIVNSLAPDFSGIPEGTQIILTGEGAHELILTHVGTGCADTLTIFALDGVDVLDIVTVENVPSQIVCLDITGLPGNFTGISICQAPLNGMIISSGNCFTFNPNNGFIGTDQGCIAVCDDLGNCDTTLLNITVNPLCSLFDFFPDGVQELQVDDCQDLATYCVPVRLDSIGNYGVLDNGFPYGGGFTACNGIFTQITLDTGFHEIIFVHMNTGCQDTLLADVICSADSTGCGIPALSPTAFAVDCDETGQFCVGIALADLPNFTIEDNGAPFTGGVGACDLNGQFIGVQLDTGLHVLVFTDTVKGCSSVFVVTVNCQIFEDVTVDVEVQVGNSMTLCLEDFGFVTSLIDSLVNVCPGNGNATFEVDNQTFCVTVFGEIIGLDTACIQVFFADTSVFFTVNATVTEPCPDLIPADFIGAGVDCSLDSGWVCLPVSPADMAGKVLTLDGVVYAGTLQPCDFDSIFTLNYSSLPLQGLLGPYIIQNWTVNGDNFTGVFNTAQELADSMNIWDPTGNWQIVIDPVDQTVFITGGNAANTYGTMVVVHDLTQIQVDLGINSAFVPGGVAIFVPVGSVELAVTDPLTLCADVVTVELTCVTPDVVVDTVVIGGAGTYCLDLSELIGAVDTVFNICPGSLGEVVDFTISNNCVTYTGNEPGLDSACIVVCDDAGVCDTTYFFITVVFDGDSLPVAVNDTIITGQDQVTSINVLGNDTVISLVQFFILDGPLHGTAVFLPDGSVNYVPAPGFCDEAVPDSFTYVICNLVGCDTATVFVTVLCSGLEIFNAFSPNDDGRNDRFKINGLQNFPDHKLYVYNRWGNLIFEAVNYQSDWDGVWNGKKVPDGTYYYVLDLGNGTKPKSGHLQIMR